MPLTRPKIWDLDTNIGFLLDPITVLHQGGTIANVDIGFLFNRNNGAASNVALYWSETNGTFTTAYTNDTGVLNANIVPISYANLRTGNIIANAFYSDNYKFSNGAAFVSTSIANTVDITANVNSGSFVGLSLTTTGVTAGNYGNATSIPTIVVDSKGRITSLTSNSVSTTINLTGTTGTGSVSGGGTLTFATTNGVIISVAGSTATFATPQDVQTSATPTFAGLSVTGNISAGNLIVSNVSYTNQEIITSTEIVAGNLVANSGIGSGNVSTGAFVVVGGAGVSGSMYIGGNLNVTSTSIFTGATNHTSGIVASTVSAGTIGNSGATLTGTLSTAAQTNVTSLGTLTGLTVSGAIVPNANLTVNLGGIGTQWGTVYAGNITANTVTVGAGPISPRANAGADSGTSSLYWNNIYGISGRFNNVVIGGQGATVAGSLMDTGGNITVVGIDTSTAPSINLISRIPTTSASQIDFRTTSASMVQLGVDNASGNSTLGMTFDGATLRHLFDKFAITTTANLVVARSTAATSTTTGAVQTTGGLGVGGNAYIGGNVYSANRVGFTYTGNATSVVYQIFNSATNSLDTVFG